MMFGGKQVVVCGYGEVRASSPPAGAAWDTGTSLAWLDPLGLHCPGFSLQLLVPSSPAALPKLEMFLVSSFWGIGQIPNLHLERHE